MQVIQVEKKSEGDIKRTVVLRFQNGTMSVYDEAEQEKLSAHAVGTLAFELGGNNNKLLFIKTNKNDLLFYLEPTKEQWKTLVQLEGVSPALKELLRKKGGHELKNWMAPLAILGFFVLLVVFRSPVAGFLAGGIPFSLEKKLGDQIFQPKKSAEQKALEKQVGGLVGALVKNDGPWKDQFTLHISSDTEPNAYATIGGHIFVNKGLILNLKSIDDLMGVLAHELVHVKSRHVVKSMAQGIGVFSVLSLLFGDVTGVAAVLMDQGGSLLNLGYSRELEEEADTKGMAMVVDGGFDPEGLARSLEIIQKEQKKLMDENPAGEVMAKLEKIEILNSHPEMEKRIKGLRAKALEYKKKQPIKPAAFDYGKLQADVKEYF